MTFDRLAIPARGRTPAFFAVGIAMFQSAGELPQIPAVLSTHECREEIFSHRARGERGIRIQRLEVRAAQCIGLIHADIESPVFFPLETLRETKVRESARTIFGGLRTEARLQLRALPGTCAHADSRHVGF